MNQLLLTQVGSVDEKLELIRIAKTYSIKEGVFYISDILNTLLSKCSIRGWSVSQAQREWDDLWNSARLISKLQEEGSLSALTLPK